ncbi:AQP10 protein, partial [Atractosteus spatula]|nr:AQP10 protein [Atractosteus spatula]
MEPQQCPQYLSLSDTLVDTLGSQQKGGARAATCLVAPRMGRLPQKPPLSLALGAGRWVGSSSTGLFNRNGFEAIQGSVLTSGDMEKVQRLFRVQNQLLRQCLAELLGTYVMMVNPDRSDSPEMSAERGNILPLSPPPPCRRTARTLATATSRQSSSSVKLPPANSTSNEPPVHSTQLRSCWMFGCGAVAQVTTSGEKKGDFLSINLAFALGVTFAVHISGGVSGAHLNPAVSLSLCVLGRHQWRRLPLYILSQVTGAFLAAATVYVVYYEAIMEYCGGNLTATGPNATAGIFATYPSSYLTLWNGFVDQVIGTGMLLLCVLALGDVNNSPAPPGLEPVLVGLVVLAIGISFGSNCGYPLNPARDLGPRLFTYIAGWGSEVFTWWWVPLVGPLVGALTGTALYQLLIELHHPGSGLGSGDTASGQAPPPEEAELGPPGEKGDERQDEGEACVTHRF